MNDEIDREEEALEAMATVLMKCDHIYIIGNGGSAANAVHIANDWIACGLRAHALTGDIATLTAIANDYSYDEVFSRQVAVMLTERDILVCLSGSGRSENIWRAIAVAEGRGVGIICLFGGYNEVRSPLNSLVLQSGLDMQDAEERQILIGHEIMRRVKAKRELH